MKANTAPGSVMMPRHERHVARPVVWRAACHLTTFAIKACRRQDEGGLDGVTVGDPEVVDGRGAGEGSGMKGDGGVGRPKGEFSARRHFRGDASGPRRPGECSVAEEAGQRC